MTCSNCLVTCMKTFYKIIYLKIKVRMMAIKEMKCSFDDSFFNKNVCAMKWNFYLLLAIVIASGCHSKNEKSSSETSQADAPNIVYILADDLGYGDVSIYNSGSKINTPNIDSFAMESMRFTDVHAPSSVCTPSRYGILTGDYCWRSRLPQGVLSG